MGDPIAASVQRATISGSFVHEPLTAIFGKQSIAIGGEDANRSARYDPGQDRTEEHTSADSPAVGAARPQLHTFDGRHAGAQRFAVEKAKFTSDQVAAYEIPKNDLTGPYCALATAFALRDSQGRPLCWLSECFDLSRPIPLRSLDLAQQLPGLDDAMFFLVGGSRQSV